MKAGRTNTLLHVIRVGPDTRKGAPLRAPLICFPPARELEPANRRQ